MIHSLQGLLKSMKEWWVSPRKPQRDDEVDLRQYQGEKGSDRGGYE